MTTTALHQPYMPPFPWDLDALPFVAPEDVRTIPDGPGLYFFRTPETLLYIGQSLRVRWRLRSHDRLPHLLSTLGTIMLAWLPLPHATSSLLRTLESLAITYYVPTLNGTPLPPRTRLFTYQDPAGELAQYEARIVEYQQAGRPIRSRWYDRMHLLRRQIEEDGADA